MSPAPQDSSTIVVQNSVQQPTPSPYYPDGFWSSTNIILIVIGFLVLALIGVIGWFIRSKIADFTKTDERVEGKVDKLDDKISIMDSRVSKIEGRIFNLAVSASPIALTPLGEEVVRDSGILEILRSKEENLIASLRSGNPQTAYDVQERILVMFTVQGLSLTVEEQNRLKEYAYTKGLTIDQVLYAGALRFRETALAALNMRVEDIDG